MANVPSTSILPTNHTLLHQLLRNKRIWLASLVLVYLGSRLASLGTFPMFNDEAMYLRRARYFPEMLPDTLINGKLLQELFLALLIHLPGDPLLLSRFLSVICGLGTLVAIFLIARLLNHPHAGLLAGLLYTTAPMTVFFDRLALPDSMLTCVASFTLLLSITFIQTPHPSRKQAALLGALIGLASLVKMTGLFLFALPVLMTLLMNVSWTERRQRLALLRTTLMVALLFVAALAPFHYGGIERDYAQASSITQKVVTLGENATYIGELLLFYLPGVLLLPPIFLLLLSRPKTPAHHTVLLLTTSGLILIATFLVISNTIHSRYLMPAWPALLLASTISIETIWQLPEKKQSIARTVSLLALGGGLIWNSYFALRLIHDPATAPLVATDRRGYLENWTAGYNIPEMMAVIAAETQQQGQMVLVNHARGRLIHMAAKFYLADNSDVIIEDIDLTTAAAPEKLHQLTMRYPTYLLLDGEEYDLLTMPQRFPEAEVIHYVEHPTSSMRFYLLFYGETPPTEEPLP